MKSNNTKQHIKFYLTLLLCILMLGCAGTMQIKHLDKYLVKYQKGDVDQAKRLAERFDKIPNDLKPHALKIFKEMGDTIVLPYLENWLEHYDTKIADAVVEAVGGIKHPDGATVIKKYLLSRLTPDTDLAVKALAEIGKHIINPAYDLLNEENDLVAAVAAEAFIVLGKPAIEPIVQKYTKASQAQKTYSEQILGEIGEPAYVFLIPVLAESKRRTLAENVLINGSGNAVPTLLSELGKNDYSQNKRIHKILVEIGVPSIPLTKEKLTNKETSIDDKLLLTKVLSEIDDPLSLEALLAGTTDSNTGVILYCLRYIALRPGVIAARPMTELLRIDNDDIRLKAKEVLIAIGLPAAEVVQGIIEDEDPFVRKMAYQVLDQIGVSGDNKILISGLSDPDPIIRTIAVERIDKEKGEERLNWVTPLMLDDYAIVRYSLNATYARAGREAFPLLLNMMEDGEDVKWPPANLRNDLFFRRLIHALIAVGNPQALNSMINQWDNMGHNSRTSMEYAFITLGHTFQGMKVLESLLTQNLNPGQIATLLQSLIVIDIKLTDEIIPLISNPDPNVRSAAAKYVTVVENEELRGPIAAQLERETYYPAIINQLQAMQQVGKGNEISIVSTYLSSLNFKIRSTARAAVLAMFERTEESQLAAVGHLGLAHMFAIDSDYAQAEKHYIAAKELKCNDKKVEEKISLMNLLGLYDKEDNRTNNSSFTRLWARYSGLIPTKALSALENGSIEKEAASDPVFDPPQHPADLDRDPEANYVDGFDIAIISISEVSELSSGNFKISSKNGYTLFELKITNLSNKPRYIYLDLVLARFGENQFIPISNEGSKIIAIGQQRSSETITINPGKSIFKKLVFEKVKKDKFTELLIFPSDYLGSLPVAVKL